MVGRTTLRLLLFRAEVMVVICKLAEGGARGSPRMAGSKPAGRGRLSARRFESDRQRQLNKLNDSRHTA